MPSILQTSAVSITSRRRMASRFWAEMGRLGAPTRPQFVSFDGLPGEQSTTENDSPNEPWKPDTLRPRANLSGL